MAMSRRRRRHQRLVLFSSGYRYRCGRGGQRDVRKAMWMVLWLKWSSGRQWKRTMRVRLEAGSDRCCRCVISALIDFALCGGVVLGVQKLCECRRQTADRRDERHLPQADIGTTRHTETQSDNRTPKETKKQNNCNQPLVESTTSAPTGTESPPPPLVLPWNENWRAVACVAMDHLELQLHDNLFSRQQRSVGS